MTSAITAAVGNEMRSRLGRQDLDPAAGLRDAEEGPIRRWQFCVGSSQRRDNNRNEEEGADQGRAVQGLRARSRTVSSNRER